MGRAKWAAGVAADLELLHGVADVRNGVQLASLDGFAVLRRQLTGLGMQNRPQLLGGGAHHLVKTEAVVTRERKRRIVRAAHWVQLGRARGLPAR